MKGGGGGQDQSNDNSYTLLWILGGIFVISGLIWHFWSAQLKMGFIWVKKYAHKPLV